MADWIDENSHAGMPEGAEDGTYLSQNPPYRAANGLVATTTEMMALPGMTRDEFERIRPYVAALAGRYADQPLHGQGAGAGCSPTGGSDFGNEELLAANRKDGCYPTKRVPADRLRSCPATHHRSSFRKIATGSAP